MNDLDYKQLKEVNLWLIGSTIIGILLQMVVGWNPISSLIGIAAAGLFITIPMLLFETIPRVFSGKTNSRRKQRKEINRLQAQQRALELEREARAQRLDELKRKKQIESDQQNEKEKRIKNFLKDYPYFVKLVKGYCSFFSFLFPFLKYAVIAYGVFFLGSALLIMIDDFVFDQQYEDIISLPLRTVIMGVTSKYVQGFGDKYGELLVMIMIIIVALFFYGKSKLKIWAKTEKQET